MRLICPSCGATHSAEGWSSDADARQCIKIVGELPWDVSRRALAYLALFRAHGNPASPCGLRRDKGGLRWAKALRLLHELTLLINESFISWDGKPARPCDARIWALAMEKVIENPPKRLPLKSHGYLRAVAYEVADELDRGAESSKIKAERSGRLRSGEQGAGSGEPERIDPEVMKKITQQNFRKRGNREKPDR